MSVTVAAYTLGPDFTLMMNRDWGPAPYSRWVVIRGDDNVRQLRIDYTGDGTWDYNQNVRDAEQYHTWTKPGTYVMHIAATGPDGRVTHKQYVIDVVMTHRAPHQQNCPDNLCIRNPPTNLFEWGQSVLFTPADVWNWIKWITIVGFGLWILYAKYVRRT